MRFEQRVKYAQLHLDEARGAVSLATVAEAKVSDTGGPAGLRAYSEACERADEAEEKFDEAISEVFKIVHQHPPVSEVAVNIAAQVFYEGSGLIEIAMTDKPRIIAGLRAALTSLGIEVDDA